MNISNKIFQLIRIIFQVVETFLDVQVAAFVYPAVFMWGSYSVFPLARAKHQQYHYYIRLVELERIYVAILTVTNRRAIAGCCSGIAPQAHYLVWKNIVTKQDNAICVNLLIDHKGELANVACEYPNEGRIEVMLKETAPLKIRIPKWAGERITLLLNGKQISEVICNRNGEINLILMLEDDEENAD